MRCPSCNKFTQLDADDDPIVDEFDVKEDAVVAAIRIQNLCDTCGEVLTEGRLAMSEPLNLNEKEQAHRTTCALYVEDHEADRFEELSPKTRARFYGAALTVLVVCGCKALRKQVELRGVVQASAMRKLT
jgi:hypothetical protein